MPYLGIFGLKFENNIVKESAPSNFSDCKILRKKKCLKLPPKISYFGVFGVEFQNFGPDPGSDPL